MSGALKPVEGPPLIAPELDPPQPHAPARRPGRLTPVSFHPSVVAALASLPTVEEAVRAAARLGQLLGAGTMAPYPELMGCLKCGVRGMAEVVGVRRCLECGEGAP